MRRAGPRSSERPTGHMEGCCANKELQCRQQCGGTSGSSISGTDLNLEVGEVKDTFLEEGASTLTAGVRRSQAKGRV